MMKKISKVFIIVMLLLIITSIVYAQIITNSRTALEDIKNESEYIIVDFCSCSGKEYYEDDGTLVCEGDYICNNKTEYEFRGVLTTEEEIKLLRQAIYELNERVKVLEANK